MSTTNITQDEQITSLYGVKFDRGLYVHADGRRVIEEATDNGRWNAYRFDRPNDETYQIVHRGLTREEAVSWLLSGDRYVAPHAATTGYLPVQCHTRARTDVMREDIREAVAGHFWARVDGMQPDGTFTFSVEGRTYRVTVDPA